jgi:type II secretory pathway component GspD/PulD (secretin)
MTFRRTFLLLVLTPVVCGCLEREPREMEGERILREWEESMQKVPARRTGNVTITVEKIVTDRNESSHASVAWRYAGDNIAVGGGPIARRNGIRVGVVKDGFAAQLRAALQKGKRKQTSKMWLTALSGHPAVINVGRDTYVEILRYRTSRGDRVLVSKAFVGGAMVIEPTILPDDRVRVRLHPRFTTRDGRSLNLTDATTEVVVAHGQPLVIGGFDQSSDSAGSALFSWSANRRRQKMTMIVTPCIEGAP